MNGPRLGVAFNVEPVMVGNPGTGGDMEMKGKRKLVDGRLLD